MAHPSVSIVIPTYGHGAFVPEAVNSVLAQTFADFELIVVNDGSPDDTAEVLRPWRESGRIKYVEQPNAGQAAARNRGIAEASGRYVALLDDDDVWPADHLQWQVAELEADPQAVLVYGSSVTLGDATAVPWPGADAPAGEVLDRFTECWIVSPGQTLIRRSALEAVGGLDPALWGVDDWDLYIRLARRGTFVFRDRVALFYRSHPANASSDFLRMYRNGMRAARKNFSGPGEAERFSRAAAFVRTYAASKGMYLVAQLRSQKRWLEMSRALLKTLWIQPRLLAPDALVRRATRVLAPGRADALADSTRSRAEQST